MTWAGIWINEVRNVENFILITRSRRRFRAFLCPGFPLTRTTIPLQSFSVRAREAVETAAKVTSSCRVGKRFVKLRRDLKIQSIETARGGRRRNRELCANSLAIDRIVSKMPEVQWIGSPEGQLSNRCFRAMTTLLKHSTS